MKTNKNILLLIIFFITLSCTKKDTYNVKKEIVVTGRIHQFDRNNTKYNFIYSQPGIKESSVILDIDSTGNFEYKIESYIPLDATISNRNTNAKFHFIYHPGDSIHIEFETKTESLQLLKTVKFSGDGAKTNNQIVNFQISREENNLGYEAINESESNKKNLQDFLDEINLLEERQLKIYSTFVEKYSPTEEAKNWAALFALETYYYFLDVYSWQNNNLPENYFDYSNEIHSLTIDKLLCWKVMEHRISKYTQNKLFRKFGEQYPEIDLISSLIDKQQKLILYL